MTPEQRRENAERELECAVAHFLLKQDVPELRGALIEVREAKEAMR